MILQALTAYYEALDKRGEISKPGYGMANVSFALNISEAGELLDVIPLKDDVQRGNKTAEIPKSLPVPLQEKRASNVLAFFLCDHSGYFLGIDSKGKPERTAQCFAASRELHLKVLEQADSAAARSVKAFFSSWDPAEAAEHPALKNCFDEIVKGGFLIFQIDGGDYAQQDTEVCEAWNRYYNGSGSQVIMQCLVSGKYLPVARLHASVKGVRGSQSMGASLVSFNDDAYESYGRHKQQGLNAPVSEYAAFAYTTALSKLLGDERHRQFIGDTTMVYWAENGDPELQDTWANFWEPKPDNSNMIHGVFEKLAQGKPVDEIDVSQPFYVLGLSPNASRLSVRFFIRDSFGNMLENLRKHYERLELMRPSYDSREYLAPYELLRETVNPNSRDKASSPVMSGAVLRAILTGEYYPASLYQNVLLRIRAEQEVTRGKAAIIKAFLLRNGNERFKEVLTVALNEQTDNKAYVLGRLFAILEQVQESANGTSTLRERFFNSACANPGSVFPRLLKLSNAHLSKLKRDMPGAYVTCSKAIGNLLGRLDEGADPLPPYQTLDEQGIFILGYYHQVQKRFEKKEREEEKNV